MARGDYNRKIIDREEFYDLYVNQNYSIKELAKHFNCSSSRIQRARKEFNLKKTREQEREIRKSSQKSRMVAIPDNFEYLYIVENKTLGEISQELGITKAAADTIKTKLGLRKTKQQRDEVAKRLAVERFSDPEKAKEISRKRAETNLERYGCINPLQNPEIKEKAEQTNLIKYGVKNPFQAEIFKEKSKETCLAKYGKEYASQSDEVKEKAKATSLERFGVENASSSPIVREKVKETNFSKYDGKWFQQKHIPDLSIEIISSKEKFLEYVEHYEYRTTKSIAKSLGVSQCEIQHKIAEYDLYYLVDSKASYEEEQIANFLDSLGVKHQKSKKIIRPKEIDLYCPDFSVGVEFNGDYWHREERMGKMYHQEKSLDAREKGVFLYHIFEYEWDNPDTRKKVEEDLRNIFSIKEVDALPDTIEIDIGKFDVSILERCGYKMIKRTKPKPHSVIGGRFVVYDCGTEIWSK